jgi:excisionase family DNA binding protein
MTATPLPSAGSLSDPNSPVSSPPQERPVLSVAEVADLLGVSQWLVLQQVGRGSIPHKRVGRRILFPRTVFLAWLETADQQQPSDRLDPPLGWQLASDDRPRTAPSPEPQGRPELPAVRRQHAPRVRPSAPGFETSCRPSTQVWATSDVRGRG